MRVIHAALVWVFGVAATLLGVGSFGGTANPPDDQHVQAAAPAAAHSPTNPVRETKAPVPAIRPYGVDLVLAIPDAAAPVATAPIVVDLAVRPARAPPASTRV